jgi:hypothetical protein
MAIGTLAERNSGVTRLVVRAWGMTLRTRNLRVQAGERIFCLRMIELSHRHRLPVVVVVALQTVFSQTALVLVLVAGGASGGYAQEGLVQILDLDLRSLAGWDSSREVAFVAGQP